MSDVEAAVEAELREVREQTARCLARLTVNASPSPERKTRRAEMELEVEDYLEQPVDECEPVVGHRRSLVEQPVKRHQKSRGRSHSPGRSDRGSVNLMDGTFQQTKPRPSTPRSSRPGTSRSPRGPSPAGVRHASPLRDALGRAADVACDAVGKLVNRSDSFGRVGRG